PEDVRYSLTGDQPCIEAGRARVGFEQCAVTSGSYERASPHIGEPQSRGAQGGENARQTSELRWVPQKRSGCGQSRPTPRIHRKVCSRKARRPSHEHWLRRKSLRRDRAPGCACSHTSSTAAGGISARAAARSWRERRRCCRATSKTRAIVRAVSNSKLASQVHFS